MPRTSCGPAAWPVPPPPVPVPEPPAPVPVPMPPAPVPGPGTLVQWFMVGFVITGVMAVVPDVTGTGRLVLNSTSSSSNDAYGPTEVPVHVYSEGRIPAGVTPTPLIASATLVPGP